MEHEVAGESKKQTSARLKREEALKNPRLFGEKF